MFSIINGRRNLLIFLFGAFIYGAIEVLWRGYTHIAMLFLGGILFTLLYILEKRLSFLPLFLRWILYAAMITAAELLAGIYLNLYLGLGIWDYSSQPMNLLGQICLPYSLLWILLSAAGSAVSRMFRFAFEQ